MIHIVFVPANKPGTYWPLCEGARLCKATRQPFFDGARVLLSQGVHPETPIDGRHQGSETIALQATVAEAAKWSVTERDRGGPKRIQYAAYVPGSRDTRESPPADVGSSGISEPEEA